MTTMMKPITDAFANINCLTSVEENSVEKVSTMPMNSAPKLKLRPAPIPPTAIRLGDV